MNHAEIRVTEIMVISFILILQTFSYSIEKVGSSKVDIFEAKDIRINSTEDKVTMCVISICAATSNDDIVIGSSLSETIYGLNGNDAIQGNGGEDVIYGGLGGDTIQGGSGLDKLFGQDGNDYLFADSSTSLVGALTESKLLRIDGRLVDLGPSLTKTIITDNPKETTDVFTPLLHDTLLSPQSFLDGGEGDDHLYGGSGDDVLLGGPGHDLFDCGEGSDRVLDFNSDEDTISTNCEII